MDVTKKDVTNLIYDYTSDMSTIKFHAKSARQHLQLNAIEAHDVIVLPKKSYNLALEYLTEIINK